MNSKKLFFGILCLPFLSTLFALKSVAGVGSTYDFSWLDPDKEVYVLQNKKYRKKLRPYAQLGGGVTSTGPYVDSTVYHGRVGMFYTEDLGVEFIYTQANNTFNDYERSVRMAGAVPFTRKIENYYGGMLTWSPFYAKLNTFNFIFYMDMILGAGVAKLEDSNNKAEYGNTFDATIINETHTAGLWSVGLRLHLFEHFGLRFDVLGTHYEAQFPDRFQGGAGASYPSQMYNNYDVIGSLVFVI